MKQNLEQQHATAQRTRRTLETEFNGIDAQIAAGIEQSNTDAVLALKKRKAELPELLNEASKAESELYHQLIGPKYEEARLAASAAETSFQTMEARHSQRRAEMKAEDAAMTAEWAREREELTRVKMKAVTLGEEFNKGQTGYQRAQQRLAASIAA